MASIVLKAKISSPFTMVMAEFPFTYRLIQGSGQAEYKRESEPFPWKVDVWHACRVTFHSSGGLGAFLEVRTDGEIEIERGYTYLFGLAAPAPEPEPPTPEPPGGEPEPPAPEPTPPPQPEPQPEPPPLPIPPVPSVAMPNVITTAGYRDVTRPAAIFWGTSQDRTAELVWSVPEAWVEEAWAEVRRVLIDRINEAIRQGKYDIEYHVRG